MVINVSMVYSFVFDSQGVTLPPGSHVITNPSGGGGGGAPQQSVTADSLANDVSEYCSDVLRVFRVIIIVC